MFSEEDLRDIFETVPPQSENILPPLVLLSSGHGFATELSLFQNFKSLLESESGRLPLTDVGRFLDVDNTTILRLLRACPHLALLSENEQTVIATKERRKILEKLRESLKSRLVSKTSFSREDDVSLASISALSQAEGIYEMDDQLYSAQYEQDLSNTLKEKIDRSLNDTEPFEINSSTFNDTAPIWFIQRIVRNLLNEHDLSPLFHIEEQNHSTRYIPKESIVRRREAVIFQLESGQLTHIDIRTFMTTFKDLFSTFNDASEYLAELPFVFHLIPFAISRSWISTLGNKYTQILEAQDYVDCATDIPADLPRYTRDSILELIIHRVIGSDSLSPENLCQADSFVLTIPHYNRECVVLFDLAKTQATSQWQAYRETPRTDLKFQMADIFTAIPPDRPVLRTVANAEGVEGATAEHFWAVISELETQNEADFSAFWGKRVLSRQQNHWEALEAIEDVKLHDQLAELLATYLKKELVTDMIAKARSQGLACSRKTQKNILKLEAALKLGKKDLTGTLASIEKLSKRQDMGEMDTVSLEETKKVLVGDMVRRMQKPKTDGPLLFLTLVGVLFARHYPGVIYATGKFAPKLLKLLKPKLSAEDYEELEAWKESAKVGTLGADEQKTMNQMLGEG